MQKLAAAGAEVIGVPCNTAHASLIFDVVEREVATQLPGIQLLHLIRETVVSIGTFLPRGSTLGLLATPGTHASGVYQTYMGATEPGGSYRLIEPDAEGQYRVRDAIYDTSYGIKAQSTPVTSQAIDALTTEVWQLHTRGADAVIMGCTEIPLALDCRTFPFPLIDPALVLARALIRAAGPLRRRSAQPATTLQPPRRTYETANRGNPPPQPWPSVA
jgi:aspartate racemase